MTTHLLFLIDRDSCKSCFLKHCLILGFLVHHYIPVTAEICKRHLMTNYLLISLITLHGFPTATQFTGISLVTTLPAPITAPSPIDTPGRMTTPTHILICMPVFTQYLLIYSCQSYTSYTYSYIHHTYEIIYRRILPEI